MSDSLGPFPLPLGLSSSPSLSSPAPPRSPVRLAPPAGPAPVSAPSSSAPVRSMTVGGAALQPPSTAPAPTLAEQASVQSHFRHSGSPQSHGTLSPSQSRPP
eukprot:1199008-Rhodomonas_salina.2